MSLLSVISLCPSGLYTIHILLFCSKIRKNYKREHEHQICGNVIVFLYVNNAWIVFYTPWIAFGRIVLHKKIVIWEDDRSLNLYGIRLSDKFTCKRLGCLSTSWNKVPSEQCSNFSCTLNPLTYIVIHQSEFYWCNWSSDLLKGFFFFMKVCPTFGPQSKTGKGNWDVIILRSLN